MSRFLLECCPSSSLGIESRDSQFQEYCKRELARTLVLKPNVFKTVERAIWKAS